MNPAVFLKENKETWADLERFEDRIAKNGWSAMSKKDIWELAGLYRRASAHLAIAKTVLPGSILTLYLNQLVGRIYNLLYRPQPNSIRVIREFFAKTFPQIAQKNRRAILLAGTIMILAALLGFAVTMADPSVASAFLADETMNQVRRGHLWVENILNVVPSSVLATKIFCNNISVSFAAFALGALFGIGSAYMLFLNGLMLGCLFAFTFHFGKLPSLFSFVIAHGPLELTLIAVAAGAGFLLGQGLLFPGSASRAEAFQERGREGTILVLGSIPFFIFAGLVEGFVSPSEDIALSSKIFIGLFLWVTYIAYIFFYKPKTKEIKLRSLESHIDELDDMALLRKKTS